MFKRKKRRTSPTELALKLPPELAAIRPLPEDTRAVILDQGSLQALLCLGTTFVSLPYAVKRPDAVRGTWMESHDTSPYIAARLCEETATIEFHARRLARLLLRHTVGGETVHPSAFAEAQQAIQTAYNELRLPLDETALKLDKAMSTSRGMEATTLEIEKLAGEYLGEVGREEFKVTTVVHIHNPGVLALAWYPEEPWALNDKVYVALIDTLEYLGSASPALHVECEPSMWWFTRWAACEDEDLVTNKRWMSRCMEWMYVDRATVATGESVIEALLCDPLIERMPPRQLALARAYRGSRSSIFIVRECSGTEAVVEDVLDGERLRLRAPVGALSCNPGDFVAGRVLALGDGSFVHSPGSEIVAGTGQGDRMLARVHTALDRARASLHYPAVAVEAVLGTELLGLSLPKDIPPAESKRAAKLRLRQLDGVVRAARDDIVLSEYVATLREQAGVALG